MDPWNRINITDETGNSIDAIAPVIISASRSTDIPAWYADWFIDRIKKGYLAWINPFNQRPSFVSFKETKVIVFWTKYSGNLLFDLPLLDEMGIHYYFQYTLNDYLNEDLEPGIPLLEERTQNFKTLSTAIGKDKVIWRFDPVLLSDTISVDTVLSRIKAIGEQIHPFTKKLVFSFIDIEKYKKVKSNVKVQKIRELDTEERAAFVEGLVHLNEAWGLELATCGEDELYDSYGIKKNSCIDGGLIGSLFPEDLELLAFLKKNNKKDSGQRASCGCIWSKDIGQYNTCIHMCRYCYANRSETDARKNYQSHQLNPHAATITGQKLEKIPVKESPPVVDIKQTKLDFG